MQDKFSHSAESAPSPLRRVGGARDERAAAFGTEGEEEVETACPSCSSLPLRILPLPLESAIVRERENPVVRAGARRKRPRPLKAPERT